jgi:hypothetical protein
MTPNILDQDRAPGMVSIIHEDFSRIFTGYDSLVVKGGMYRFVEQGFDMGILL